MCCCQMWRQQFQGLTTVPAVLLRQVQLAVLVLMPVWRWPRARHAHRLYLAGVASPGSLRTEGGSSLAELSKGVADHREYQSTLTVVWPSHCSSFLLSREPEALCRVFSVSADTERQSTWPQRWHLSQTFPVRVQKHKGSS